MIYPTVNFRGVLPDGSMVKLATGAASVGKALTDQISTPCQAGKTLYLTDGFRLGTVIVALY